MERIAFSNLEQKFISDKRVPNRFFGIRDPGLGSFEGRDPVIYGKSGIRDFYYERDAGISDFGEL